jgi:hypothetical protein
VDFLQAKPEVDVVYGDVEVFTAEGDTIYNLISAPWNLLGIACAGLHAMQPATFFRSSAFRRSPGFNPVNPSCWDRELLVDLALSGSTFRHLSGVLAGHRLHAESITVSGRLRNVNARQHDRILEKVLGRSLRPLDRLLRPIYRIGWRLRSPRKVAEDVRWTVHPKGRLARMRRHVDPPLFAAEESAAVAADCPRASGI